MANALGRISGQLLKDNLTREGRELAFDTDLLFLNVSDGRIGVNNDVPTKQLDVSGTTTTKNLIVDQLFDTIRLSTQVRISGNTVNSLTDNLNLTASNYVFGNNVRTSKLDFNNNVISSLATDTNIEIRPNQTGANPLLFGSLDIYSNLNITGDLYSLSNITLDGNITFGSDGNDTISFAADVNSDIIPDQHETYTLGSNSKKWEGLYTELINGEQVASSTIASGGVDLALLPGKIWYVATNGSDVPNPELTQGKHQSAPFASIGEALSQATAGDTVYIYPGTYTETFPLIVPVGVAVNGTGIRSVAVQPTVPTQLNNAFLLNGESTVSDLTVKDFYAPGYAFSFAPGFTVTTRSPYVQNITVITKGSVTTLADPRGFDQGDAGGGARVDGSLATASSKEATMLFHSVTFITPGVDALVMTNGVRVEWLNSFSYFANRGIYATNGTLGFASLGVKFGAELRSIGSANVYGNYGAVADGASALMYLIQHNFAYIGAGKDITNDASLGIEENETVEIAAGKIYYQSLDNAGNFRVGDAFGVSFETGLVTINGVSVSAGGVSSINFAAGTDETVIDSGQVTTGNVKFSNNLITTLSGPTNLVGGTGEINLNANTDVTDNLDIIGNFNVDGTLTIGNAFIDIVRFTAPVEFDLRPKTDDDFTLGGAPNKRWDRVYLDTSYIGSYKLENSTISTVPTDADIELRADGTGRIFVNQNNVEFDQDLTVSEITNFGDNALTAAATVTGIIDHLGLLDRTGDTGQTGTYNQTGYLDVSSNVQIANVTFIDNTISTVTLDSNLELGAASTGKVKIPSADVQIDHNLFVTSDISAGSVGVTTDIVTDSYTNGDIEISLDLITTTLTDSDLEFRAAGTGKVYASQDSVKFDQDLTVDGTTALRTTNITGALTQYGDYLQTGSTLQTGNRGISSTLDVDSNVYFDSMSFVGNTITTTDANTDLQLKAASTGIVNINDNVTIDQNLRVNSTTYTNGITNSGIIESDTFSDSDIEISTNVIKTTVGSNDLRFLAAGTGIISVPNDAVEFNNNLTVNGTTNLKNTVIGTGTAITQVSQNVSGTSSPTGFFFYGWQILTPGQTVSTFSAIQPGWTVVGQPTWVVSVVGDGVTNYDITITGGVFASGGTYSFTGPLPSDITHVGDYYQTGNTLQTGNRTITGTLDVTNNVYFDNINIVDNRIFTTNLNDDLELRAAGTTGKVIFNEVTEFSQAALFGTLVTNGLTNSGTITSDIFSDSDIEINDNYITTTVGNNDLRLIPNGVGKVSLPLDPVAITQDLTVEDDAILKNTVINGNIVHVGNTTETGNVGQTGDFDLSNNLTVTGTDAFFTDVRIINNLIATSTGNNNLELGANGTGIIKIADSATFGQTLTVNGITTTSTLSTVTGTITSDIFSDSDIEINDNYITTTVGNNNLILSGNGTGGPKLEKIKFNSSTINTDTLNEGITLTVPSGSVTISAATALRVPVGTTANRSTLTQGEFRFDTTDNLFRGYSTSTVSFAGVYSADRRTSVLAHPTNNTLLFTINTLNNMTVSSTGLTVNSLTVDNNITLATNIISTAATNNDLYLTPNGTGKVVMDSISLGIDEISNSANAAMVLQNTGNGYVRFSGTGGLALPAGPTVVDTSGVELGDLRYNTTLSIPEIFNGVAYVGFVSESAELLSAAEVQEITNLWALVIG
jgi:hypothetical protein